MIHLSNMFNDSYLFFFFLLYAIDTSLRKVDVLLIS